MLRREQYAGSINHRMAARRIAAWRLAKAKSSRRAVETRWLHSIRKRADWYGLRKLEIAARPWRPPFTTTAWSIWVCQEAKRGLAGISARLTQKRAKMSGDF